MTTAKPPRARQVPHCTTWHGHELNDPYHWLRDPNWQAVLKDPGQLQQGIRDYLTAENAYTQAVMSESKQLEEQLYKELRGRIKDADAAVPLPDGPYFYGDRYGQGAEYKTYYRVRQNDQAGEEIILDVSTLAKGKGYCKVSDLQHSPDHALLAYTVDVKGSERYELRLRESRPAAATANGAAEWHDLDLKIEDVSSFVWGTDGRTLYYTLLDDNHRPKWLKRHVLGTAVQQDETLYTEADGGFVLGLGRTQSRDFIVLTVHDHTCTEVHVLDARNPKSQLRLITARQPMVVYRLEHNGDFFYLQVHAGAAKDGRIMLAPVATPELAHWQELVGFRSGCLLHNMLMFKDHLVRLEIADALPRIVVRALSSGDEHSIVFGEAAYSLALVPGYEFHSMALRFTYASPATPAQTYDYHLQDRSRSLRKEQEIPSGHRAADYEVSRLMCPARDGAMVPITLLRHRKNSIPGGPLLLYGYGSYGHALPTGFAVSPLSLVNRGVTYALAHVRGGKDKGYGWYEGAKILSKKNTFTDFIDCGEFLAANGITKRGQIVAHGGSAGGMLVGAVANMAPELFLGIIAEVPFVDVLNTMLDKELPLTPLEWPEWGNPLQSQAAYEYIASYSPYDNVTAKAYPHMLVLAGLTDPRVTYWEPAKWVARLRELKTDQHKLLLLTDMDAGHGGASGRYEYLKKIAMIQAFVLGIAGLNTMAPGR